MLENLCIQWQWCHALLLLLFVKVTEVVRSKHSLITVHYIVSRVRERWVYGVGALATCLNIDKPLSVMK